MNVPIYVTLTLLPVSFWVVMALLIGGTVWAMKRVDSGLGLPVITVLGTAATWYVFDAFYNNYVVYAVQFSSQVLSNAWWQVAIFLATFLYLTPRVHQWINRRELNGTSQVAQMIKGGTDQPEFQAGLPRLLAGCLIVWAILSAIAILRLKDESLYYFCPYLSYRADPWGRGRLGSGFDSLLSLAGYLELFLAMTFGGIFALAKKLPVRSMALLAMVLSWPYYVFDRTRNPMLALVLPAVLAWIFLRWRVSLAPKLVVLALCFFLINSWFGFVLSHRSDIAIASAFADEGFDVGKGSDIHQEGLNMFEELCWCNTFIDEGSYEPSWGYDYFAEITNPIPRTLWPGKPMLGLDYSLLRGQAFDAGDAGVGATVSTGMIGQGVLNFGQLIGPAFAAFLMSLWVALLAWLDLSGHERGRVSVYAGHLPLYGLGLILTFNLGRDITLITLYTFFFGGLLIWMLDYSVMRSAAQKINEVPRTDRTDHRPILGPDRAHAGFK